MKAGLNVRIIVSELNCNMLVIIIFIVVYVVFKLCYVHVIVIYDAMYINNMVNMLY